MSIGPQSYSTKADTPSTDGVDQRLVMLIAALRSGGMPLADRMQALDATAVEADAIAGELERIATVEYGVWWMRRWEREHAFNLYQGLSQALLVEDDEGITGESASKMRDAIWAMSDDVAPFATRYDLLDLLVDAERTAMFNRA